MVDIIKKLELVQYIRSVLVKSEYFDEDLYGACAIASVVLYYYFSLHGHHAVIAANDTHSFIISEGIVFDITASQFKNIECDIIICQINDLEKLSNSKYYIHYKNWKIVPDYCIDSFFSNWSDYQKPSNDNIEYFIGKIQETKIRKMTNDNSKYNNDECRIM